MEMNTGILRDVHADEYGFSITDLTVAALIKAYLQTLRAEVVPEELNRIVSSEIRELRGGTVKGRGLAAEQWSEIDCDALAMLIDTARTAATISAMEWKAQPGEKLLERTIAFMRDDLFPALDGKNYVESMPVEMAEFITDCWLAVA
jgi:hypothetical protein